MALLWTKDQYINAYNWLVATHDAQHDPHVALLRGFLVRGLAAYGRHGWHELMRGLN